MYPKYFIVQILLTMVSPTFGLGDLPSGNFGHFGPCILKFLNFEHLDLTENLIHANNPANLIYTVSGRYNVSTPDIQDQKDLLDFKFYEICTITVFTNIEIQDNRFRSDYSHGTRDGNRGRKHSIIILISQLPPQDVILLRSRGDFSIPSTIFAIYAKTMEWFFVCAYCRNVFLPIFYTHKVKRLTVNSLRTQWLDDVYIAVILVQVREHSALCGKGQYHISPLRKFCSTEERQYLTLSDILNLTFVPSITFSHRWGYFHENIHVSKFYYVHINIVVSLEPEGFNALHCNFNVWSERSDLHVWVSAFGKEVWLGCAGMVGVLVLGRIFKDLFHLAKIRMMVKNVAEVVFSICATFVRQASTSKYLSVWIFVSLLFSSFILLAQYEIYLTANLVIPPPAEKFGTLRAFFDKGYTLVYRSEEYVGMFSVRSKLEEEFARNSLGGFPHEKTIRLRYVLL